jgi:glycosyltransferase involved in cell wall biosynthesis
MEGKITLLGFRTDIKELLSSCDIVIQPSRREGFSISILEAASMGKPIIFSNTGGAEVLEGVCNQFIITPNSELEIEKAIKNILQLPINELNRIGCALREKVKENYTYEILTNKTEQLYQEIKNG